MRELTIRIKFTKASLGNVKDKGGNYLMPRSPSGRALFMATWHKANMRFASELLGRHQDESQKALWDILVDGVVHPERRYKRYYEARNGKRRYVLHEAFFAGQEVGINCVVPATISDDDIWRLMGLAGQYRGLSPWKSGEFGLYEVVGLLPRRPPALAEE